MTTRTEQRAWAERAAEARFAGHFDAAMDAARRAIEVDPDDVEARVHLAHAALGRHDVRTAMVACQEAMQRQPLNPHAHHAAATALAAAGEDAMAERHLRIALELDPTAGPLHVELGDLLRRGERTEEARASYERALALNEDDLDARIGLLQIADAVGVDDARDLLARAPNDAAVVSAAARVLTGAGRAVEIVPELERLCRIASLAPLSRSTLLFRLAEALDQLDEIDRAWAAWTQANTLMPDVFDPAAHRAEIDRLCAVFDRPLAPGGSTTGQSARPVFVVGMPRSGTTLLERMLDAHPRLRGGGEAGVLRRTIGRIPVLTRASAPYPECMRELDDEDRRLLSEFLRAELETLAAGHDLVIDKTPDGARDVAFAASLLPEIRVLWCRRDPLDTCLSCYQQQFRGAVPYAYDLGHLAIAYRGQERLMGHWQEVVGVPIHAVHYEMLVANPEAELGEALAFLGVEWDDACLDFHLNPRRAHTASREQVRQPLYRSAVGRYRRYEKHLRPLQEALRRTGT